MELPTPDLLKTGLVFDADGRQLYFLGARESEPDRTDIYVISENAPKPVLVVDAGGLKSAPIVDPAGKVLLYVVPAQNPLRRPAAAAAGGRGGAQDRRGGRTAAAGANAAPPTFAIVDIATRKVSTVVGARAVAVGGRQDADLRHAHRPGVQRDGRADHRHADRRQADDASVSTRRRCRRTAAASRIR